MARQIKFRAWVSSSQRMVEVCTLDWTSVACVKASDYYGNRYNILDYQPDPDPLLGPSVPSVILMQFTGLHDAEGREIYEGDIVQFLPDVRRQPLPIYYTVYWKDEATGFSPFADYGCTNMYDGGDGCNVVPELEAQFCRVIGNRWENPELVQESVFEALSS